MNNPSSHKQLLAFVPEICQEAEQQGKRRKALNMISLQKSLTRYLSEKGVEDIALRKADAAFVKGYEGWLQSKELARSTSLQYLHDLKGVLKEASERGLWKKRVALDDAFEGLTYVTIKTEKPFVAQETVSRMWALDIREALSQTMKGQGKVFEKTVDKVSIARDCFVFCFCCHGMDFLDMGRLRKENVRDGYIRYVRNKTQKEVTVEILPMMQDIIDRHRTKGEYLFPIVDASSPEDREHRLLSAQRQYNKRLAQLARLMGDDVKLTSQMPGYSWAAAAYKGGMKLSSISKAMGYSSDFALRDFLTSLDGKEDQYDENKILMENIFGE